MPIEIYTDGGSRGNPGPSAGGWVILSNGKKISQGSEYFGVGTNNQAEYKAVICALNWIVNNMETEKITFVLDSELVVRQLSGIYKIKDIELKKRAIEVHSLIKKTNAEVVFKSVKREHNKEADKLVNDSLDEAGGLR